MKLGDANYDSAVEQKRTELRGHKVTQLTESECKQEIEAIVGGAKSSFEGKGGEVFDYSISPDGKTVTIQGTDRGTKYLTGEPIQLPKEIQPKKRGRPKGSRNKPKT